MIGSRAFRALMRRNIIYRKRNIVGSLLEIALPVIFILILVAIKVSLEDSASFSPETVPPSFPNNFETIIPFSFTDYVTAIQAQRQCELIDGEFQISGMGYEGYNWQVPFVKCDSRPCEQEGEDARSKFCEYPILAVAPSSSDDAVGKAHAASFKEYVYTRYPELLDPAVLPFTYPFISEFDSDQAIEDYVTSGDYGKTGYPKIAVGVVFSAGSSAKDYVYTLRQNSTNYNSPDQESRPGTSTSPNTDTLFDSYAKTDDVCTPLDGTAEQGPLQNSCTGQYIYNGALTVQRLVGDWIMVDSGAKDAGYFVAEHGVQFVSFPTPQYVKNGFYEQIAPFAPLLVVLGLLYPVAVIIRSITLEKELRQKELMKMMSVTDSDIGWSWFLSYFIFHIVTIIAATGATSALYSNSEVIFLLLFWLFTFIATIVFCFAIASFMTKSTTATLLGILLYFVGYFLTAVVSFDTGSADIIGLCSLHPVAAFSFGLQEIGRLEDASVGVTSSTFDTSDSPSGYTFLKCLQSLIIDSLLWGFVAWYLNHVIRSDYGQPLPWYFPFTSSYWCPGRAKPGAVTEEDDDESVKDLRVPMEPVSAALREQANEGRSIEIRGLKKQYGEKTAVDGLSLSMYSGQVTALLGHNGAGKTTTISMLTGMVAPTSGYAIIAGKDIRTQMSQIREEIGICLQHDCLFPLLTVQEHIEFYARVKGMYGRLTKEEAAAKVTSSIEDVALLEKRDTLSSNLSGGMKRKLSVAIAFCGDSKTVLLDEPTSGMDPFSRRFTWNVIRQYRQDRCIILTTHFMDEADILGDRIAIMAEGQLRCAGSSLFLKKSYGVGYQLTIEKKSKSIGSSLHYATLTGEEKPVDKTGEEEQEFAIDTGVPDNAVVPLETVDDRLRQIVVDSVPRANLLSNVGTEMSFQLPLNASSGFTQMFEKLDREMEREVIVTYGVSITTLDEVFLMVARGETGEKEVLASSMRLGGIDTPSDGDKSIRSKMDLEKEGLFGRHVRALFQKRAMNFKRDKRAWVCSTIIPSIFVLIGFILFNLVAPDRNFVALSLSLEEYNPLVTKEPQNPIPYNDPGIFYCQPGVCADTSPIVNNTETGEFYTYCGAGFFAQPDGPNCSITDSDAFVSRITENGATGVGGVASAASQASLSIFETSTAFEATQYGALYFTHDSASTTNTGANYGDYVVAACQAVPRDYVNETIECESYRGIGYIVSYNFTALHASVLYQTLADQAVIREALNDNEMTISATIHPLPITATEESYGAAEDAFTAWFLLVLGFPFISATFGTFVVAEKLSKAKHLQTVAGVQPAAYWISGYMWDIMNYQLPLWITIILMFAFNVESFTTTDNGVVGGVIILMILYGPAAAGFTYCLSYMFTSPSMCQLFVIILNFFIAMAGPLISFILLLIGEDPGNPKPSLVTASNAIEWILRFIPSFNLGQGLFNAINIETFIYLAQKPITVWDDSVMLIEVIFLFVQSFAYIALAIQIDKWSANPRAVNRWNSFVRFITCRCCCGGESKETVVEAAFLDDDDVIAEQDRVLYGEANNDLIVMNQLTKQYANGKVAVNHLSLGIPPGQCFGLLGINGAGKTTTMGMLTAEFPPSSGDATLAGYSVTNDPEQTRRRIGYCPQFDAHFANMTGREHVELYAAIKGVPKEFVKEAASRKLDEVGLNEFDRDRLSAGYSGGMKRKLSVACATIGQPQIVFLDEPSTGMDPVARRDLWQVISDMVSGGGADEEKASVILTTHSMEECEALCPRIGIMAGGKLRCLGSAQHLKNKFGKGFQVEMKLKGVDTDDEDYKIILVQLQASAGAVGGEEGSVIAHNLFINLQQTLDALKALTDDTFLSDLVTANDPTGYVVYKAASSDIGVSLDVVASFATAELRMRKLYQFFENNYPQSLLRERQDSKARYEVAAQGTRISNIFASIEENKEVLMLSDYGVSQTSLEQVFNMHAAEAEKLKHGTTDG